MQEVTNFARFYGLLKKLNYDAHEQEECKRAWIRKYTGGRTDSLKEIRKAEYERLCQDLEQRLGLDDEDKRRLLLYHELKRRRSICLKLMQKMGIDTSDWERVNAFCLNPKIAGKVFRKIDLDELQDLAVKLRTIDGKGWRKEVPNQKKENAGVAGSVGMVGWVSDMGNIVS